MIKINRSYRDWKAPKVAALGEKVHRALYHHPKYSFDNPLYLALRDSVEAYMAVERRHFMTRAGRENALAAAYRTMLQALDMVATDIELTAIDRHDISVTGFTPAKHFEPKPRSLRVVERINSVPVP